MLVFGDEKNTISQAILDVCTFKNSRFSVFNLSNAIEKGVRLKKLTPPVYVEDGLGFDIFYANYIMSNDDVFVEFMNIIYKLYEGDIVYVLIDHSEYRDILTESLIKFIQQRYGLLIYMVNETEDWVYVKESEFSIQGLFNLDIDKERFTLLVADYEAIQKDLDNDGIEAPKVYTDEDEGNFYKIPGSSNV